LFGYFNSVHAITVEYLEKRWIPGDVYVQPHCMHRRMLCALLTYTLTEI